MMVGEPVVPGPPPSQRLTVMAIWPGLCLVCLCVQITTASQTSTNLKILVLGAAGSGKSTLINNILGQKLATAEVAGAKDDDEPYTTHQETISGVDVTACDMTAWSGGDKDMERIEASCSDPDLLILCQSMNNTDAEESKNEKFIELVTKHFGERIWKHSLLVLTFADKFTGKFPKHERVKQFQERRKDLEDHFQESLLRAGVSDYTVPSAVSGKRGRNLPGVPNWLNELLLGCLSQAIDIKEVVRGKTVSSGKKGIMRIMAKRLRFSDEVKKEDYKKPARRHPVEMTPSLCKFIKLNRETWERAFLDTKRDGYMTGKIVSKLYEGSTPMGYLLDNAHGYTLGYLLSIMPCATMKKSTQKDEL